MTFQTATRKIRGSTRIRRKCRLEYCKRIVYRVDDTICQYHKNRIKWLQKGELRIEL